MNDDLGYIGGVRDAEQDLAEGYVPSHDHLTLDYIVNQLRVMMGATDDYIAGYLSVIYR